MLLLMLPGFCLRKVHVGGTRHDGTETCFRETKAESPKREAELRRMMWRICKKCSQLRAKFDGIRGDDGRI